MEWGGGGGGGVGSVYRPGSSIGINRPVSRGVNLTVQKALPKCQQTTHKRTVGTIVLSSQVIVGTRVGVPETFEATSTNFLCASCRILCVRVPFHNNNFTPCDHMNF